MSWFVFTESELGVMESASDYVKQKELASELRERGEWTDDDTLLVKTTGPEATKLASIGKLPRRMARDPPTDTSPSYSEEPGVNEFKN